MKFESQICTTKEQSERLIALGLKKETADMKHFFDNRDDYSFFHCWKCWPYKWDEESLMDSENIPAWSLHRLMEIYTNGFSDSNWNMAQFNWNILIDCIECRIHEGYCNKEYLEQ